MYLVDWLDRKGFAHDVATDEVCQCGTDLHSCINCRFYEETAPHECREPHADHYVDKFRRYRTGLRTQD